MNEILLQVFFLLLGLVLGTIFGAISGFWYAEYRKRPLLHVTGGGGSNTPEGVSTNSISVHNMPAFAGVRIGSSYMFGHRIHPSLVRGVTFDRNVAKGCHAFLTDGESGEPITGLYWRTRNPDGYASSVDIASGETATLMLFARLRAQSPKYFAYSPDPKSALEVEVPAEPQQFSGDRSFTVRVTYANGLTMTANYRVHIDYRGNFQVQHRVSDGGGSSSTGF